MLSDISAISQSFKVWFWWFKNKVVLFSEHNITSKLASRQLVWSSQPTLFEEKILEIWFLNFLDIKQLILALKQHNPPLSKVLSYKHYLSRWSLVLAGRLTPAQLQLVLYVFFTTGCTKWNKPSRVSRTIFLLHFETQISYYYIYIFYIIIPNYLEMSQFRRLTLGNNFASAI